MSSKLLPRLIFSDPFEALALPPPPRLPFLEPPLPPPLLVAFCEGDAFVLPVPLPRRWAGGATTEMPERSPADDGEAGRFRLVDEELFVGEGDRCDPHASQTRKSASLTKVQSVHAHAGMVCVKVVISNNGS